MHNKPTAEIVNLNAHREHFPIEQRDGRYIKPDRCPMMEQVIGLIEQDPRSDFAIANVSGCSSSMIKAWKKGKTRRPQGVSIMLVARALGCSLKITKD